MVYGLKFWNTVQTLDLSIIITLSYDERKEQ